MVLFRRHVNHGNWFFNIQNSSLRWLIAHLGGFAPPNTLPGAAAAMRLGLPEDPIIDLLYGPVPGIVPVGWPAGPILPIPLEKRRRYRRALGYLFGLMNFPPAGGGAALAERLVQKVRREQKNGWAGGMTPPNTHFIHCSQVPPHKIQQAGGFAPQFASELCTSQPAFGGPAWPGHEFSFFFERLRNNNNPVIVVGANNYGRIRPNGAAVAFGFGAGGYIYLMRPPAGVAFWSQGGNIGLNAECAFPNLVPLAQLFPFRWNGIQAVQLNWAGAPLVPQLPVI
jgi:hypothetical protein